jgi:hypothetical protein
MSVDEQDALIRRHFPAFTKECGLDFVGAWRGPVRPIAKWHEIGIVYFPWPRFANAWMDNPTISIRLLDPVISLDPRGTGDLPPHIYYRPETKSGWSLCLYDPRTREWEGEMPIATKIIPWACEWLFYYEHWLIDGVWAGGGAHPERPRRSTCRSISPSFPDPPVRSLAAAFNRVGRLIGTFASCLSMAAASGDFSPPGCLPISKELETRLSTISIWSPAPQLAALSLSDWEPESRPGRSATSTCIVAPRSSRRSGTT